jgi:chemotaxis protein histidine kinase CheA
MDQNIFNQMKSEFEPEIQEILVLIRNLPSDKLKSKYNSFYRVISAVDGVARLGGFNDIIPLSHELKELFHSIRKQDCEQPDTIRPHIIQAFEILIQWFHGIRTQEFDENFFLIRKKLAELIRLCEKQKIKIFTSSSPIGVPLQWEYIGWNDEEGCYQYKIVSRVENEWELESIFALLEEKGQAEVYMTETVDLTEQIVFQLFSPLDLDDLFAWTNSGFKSNVLKNI